MDGDAVVQVELSNGGHLGVGLPDIQDANTELVAPENLRQCFIRGSPVTSRVQGSKGVNDKEDGFLSLGNLGRG